MISSKESKSIPKIKSLHEKLTHYYATRKRIFEESSSLKESLNIPSKINKMRLKSKLKKSHKLLINSSILNDLSDDRAFFNIKIGEIEIKGLIDSGCNLTCLGKGGIEFVNRLNINFISEEIPLQTAGGNCKTIVGYFIHPITFKNITKEFTIFICPELRQNLYLGTNFIKAYNLAPQIFPCTFDEIDACDPNRHNLTPEESNRLLCVINQFPSSEVLGLGRTHLEEHVINTKDSSPIKSRYYPVSPAIQHLIYEEIDRMLELGIIETCESPWASPVTLVRKPNKNRLCLDFRKINKVTEKLAYPIPNMEGLMSRLSNTRYISSVDLKDAFWQIPLEMSSREKTAFVVPGRPLYQFKVMPFGLCNAPQRMSKLMDKVIPQELKDCVFVYLDDLLIVTPDLNSHIEYLRKVAIALRQAGLTINIKKSKFCFRELKYLGFIVSNASLKTDPDKVSAVLNFPIPKSKKQVRGFLGLSGWYRRFINNFATLAAPLSDLLKGKTFNMTDEAIDSFHQLQKALTKAPVLSNPDFAKRFHVQCDASDSGIGGVLFQYNQHDEERPIYYFSAKLNSAQRNYSVTERECLAVIKSIEKFRPYIEGYCFNIITDHSSLKWLMPTRDLSGRLARWSLKLQNYDFTIEHRKGKCNIVADSLSRSCEAVIASLETKDPDDTINFHIDLADKAFESEEYIDLQKYILDNQEQLPDFQISNKFVYKKMDHVSGICDVLDQKVWKLWIPSTIRPKLISAAHDPPNKAHGGISKTLHRLRERYYWPYMAEEVRNYISKCHKCLEFKSPNIQLKPPMGKTFQVSRPFQHLYCDFLGPYPRSKKGNTKILIILDQLSKFILLEPIETSKSIVVMECLKERLFSTFGVPETFFSDNGVEFKSNQFENFLKIYGITHLDTPKYHPQANASERVNRGIIEGIGCYINNLDQTTWDIHLPEIRSAYLSSFHRTIGMTPFEALFGISMVQHGTDYSILKNLGCLNEQGILIMPKGDRMQIIHKHIMDKINEANQISAKSYNLRTRNSNYKPGQEVYCRTFNLSCFKDNFNRKLAPKFHRCRIKTVCGTNRYEIENLQGKNLGIYHSKDIKPF